MKTIIENSDFKVTFNGLNTYLVTDSANQCRIATTSKRKALNLFKNVTRIMLLINTK